MEPEKITTARLSKLPDTAVVIHRRRFRLVVRERTDDGRGYRDAFSCRCSIGAAGFETPTGSYLILDKQLDPSWTIPVSNWVAPDQRGRVLEAGDPNNPLKGAWLRLTDDGIGMHGTATFPLGRKASHGCIRLRPEDAVTLFGLLELGTPVTIV